MIQNKSMQDKKEVIKKEVIKKDYSNYTKKELQKELESLNINYNKKDNKNTLLELLK
jgi:cytochrome c-type biogenesis protein CcmE